MRSSLKWGNERNPHRLLQVSDETASAFAGEEGRADVKSAWRLCSGRHTPYNGTDNESRNGNVELISSNGLSVGIEACNSAS